MAPIADCMVLEEMPDVVARLLVSHISSQAGFGLCIGRGDDFHSVTVPELGATGTNSWFTLTEMQRLPDVGSVAVREVHRRRTAGNESNPALGEYIPLAGNRIPPEIYEKFG